MILTAIVLYALGALMYRLEVKANFRCVLIWPYCLARDVIAVLYLYRRTTKDVADAVDLHPWHNKTVVVADSEKNKMSSYWSPLIGRQGKVIASFGEDLLTVWLDGEAVPNEQVLTERFALIG